MTSKKKEVAKTAKEPATEELMGAGAVEDSSSEVTEEIVQDRRDLAIDVKCEACSREFKMEMPDIREREENQIPFLCPDCELKVAEAEALAEPKRKFKYEKVATRRYGLDELNKLGQEGWRAVGVLFDGVVLVEQEYFE